MKFDDTADFPLQIDRRRRRHLHADFVALVIEADTNHGGPFRQIIPWNPIGAVNTLLQIVQSAGGVVHA